MLTELIGELRNKGISIDTKAGKLVVSAPPGTMTPDLQTRIKHSRSQLLDILATTSTVDRLESVSEVSDQINYPLSASQRRTAMTMQHGAVLPSAYLLVGKLDTLILEQVLELFISRHAPLRSQFDLGADPLTQTATSPSKFELKVTKMLGANEEVIGAKLEQLQKLKTDPKNGLCFRFELLQTDPEKNILFASFSPLAFDGWSFDLFWQEITQGYAALEQDREYPFSGLNHSYADCAHWMDQRINKNSQELQKFWRNQLGEKLPLDVCTLRSAQTSTGHTKSIPLVLAVNTTQLVRQLAKNANVTPQTILMSAVYIWAARLRGVASASAIEPDLDVVLGIAVEGRPDTALESVVGPFANLMLLRNSVPESESFERYVTRIRDSFLEAHKYQEFPIEHHTVQSREGSSRLFQVEFSFQQTTERKNKMGTLEIQQLELPSGTSAVDLTFWVKDWGDRISGAIEFKTDSIEVESASMWIDCFYFLLDELLSDPGAAISNARFLDNKSRALLEEKFSSNDHLLVDQHNHIVPFGVPGFLSGKPGAYIADNQGYKPLDNINKTQQHTPSQAPPANDLEYRLELLVSGLLGKDVGMETDLFSCGLNSLSALKLIVAIKQALSITLNIPVLVQYPTIRSLANFVHSSPSMPSVKTVVPLQPNGELTPLYCICGINLYRSIALSLGENQPVYALHIPDESGQLSNTKLLSTADLAKQYWQVIKSRHECGPINLLGFCFGGALAYEIAHMAVQEGYAVSHLVMLDSALSKTLNRKLWSKLVRTLPGWLRGLFGEGRRKRLELAEANNSEGYIALALAERLDHYLPSSPYDGNTIIVDSGDSELYAAWHKKPLLGWDDALVGTVNTVTMSTQHHELLNSHNSQAIANQLSKLFSAT